jgi:hypothetical protein
MTWAEEDAKAAARLARQREWDEFYADQEAAHRSARHPVPLPPPRGPGPACPCGCQAGYAPRPGPDPSDPDDIPPSSDQPAAVLLAAHLARRNADPLTRAEEIRAIRADQVALADLEAGTVPLDGREAVRRLGVHREADGSNLAGTHALALLRQLGVAGVGHEPGVGL